MIHTLFRDECVQGSQAVFFFDHFFLDQVVIESVDIPGVGAVEPLCQTAFYLLFGKSFCQGIGSVEIFQDLREERADAVVKLFVDVDILPDLQDTPCTF